MFYLVILKMSNKILSSNIRRGDCLLLFNFNIWPLVAFRHHLIAREKMKHPYEKRREEREDDDSGWWRYIIESKNCAQGIFRKQNSKFCLNPAHDTFSMGIIDDFILSTLYYTVEAPVTFARDFIERQHAKNPTKYYHRRYPRVTDIWDCNEEDIVCMFEADSQYKRDRMVDQEILSLLKKAMGKCVAEQGNSAKVTCKAYLDEYEEAADNFYTKYSELGFHGNARRCYAKQQHRMVDERRKAEQEQES